MCFLRAMLKSGKFVHGNMRKSPELCKNRNDPHGIKRQGARKDLFWATSAKKCSFFVCGDGLSLVRWGNKKMNHEQQPKHLP